MILYFIMGARYLRFKQIFLLAKLLKMFSTLKKVLKKRNQSSQAFQGKGCVLWRRYNAFCGNLNDLSREVAGYNRFWSKYLAIYFVCYIVHTTYMPFSFLFETTEMGFTGKKIFMFFGAYISSLLFWINYECSMIVAKNILIYKERRRFAYTFAQNYKMTVWDYLKVNFKNLKICKV